MASVQDHTPAKRFGTRTIPGLMERAARTGAGISFIDQTLSGERIGYDELLRRGLAAASSLRARGVRRGDRIALLSSTSPELIVGLWGTWLAGATPFLLPLPRRAVDASEYVEDIEGRLLHTGSRLMLVAGAFAEYMKASSMDGDVVGLDQLDSPAPQAGGEDGACSDSDLALLQFTSGTTTRSRAVCLTHRQVLSHLSIVSAAAQLDAADVGVVWLPLYHDMGMVSHLSFLAHGAEAVLLPPEDFLARPGSWVDALSHFRATLTAAPNMAYALAARDLRARPRSVDLSSLRVAGNGAEAIDTDALSAFLEEGSKYGLDPTALCPTYGLAEATLMVTLSSPGEKVKEVWVSRHGLETEQVAHPAEPRDPAARPLVSCGRAIPEVEVQIRDDSGTVLGDNYVGEICLRSPSVMSGYWSDPDATESVMQDGWLRTGDLGFCRDGELFVCGRLKDMIIVGGVNLFPDDYEQSLRSVEGIRRGNIVAFGLADAERMVVIAETKRPDAEAREIAAEAMRTLTTRLSRAPEEVVIVPSGTLPKTPSGKIQRGVCRQRYLSGGLAPLAVAKRT